MMINLPAEFAAAFMTWCCWPIFSGREHLCHQHERTRLDYLFERKDQLFENLRDLNFEFRPGSTGRGFSGSARRTRNRSVKVNG